MAQTHRRRDCLYNLEPKHFAREPGESEQHRRDRVVALLKVRRRNAVISEEWKETGPYCEWKRAEISQGEDVRLTAP